MEEESIPLIYISGDRVKTSNNGSARKYGDGGYDFKFQLGYCCFGVLMGLVVLTVMAICFTMANYNKVVRK